MFVCHVCRRSKIGRLVPRSDRDSEEADELVRKDGVLDEEATGLAKPGDGISLGERGVLEVSNEEVLLLAREDCDEDLLGTTKPLMVC